MPWSFPLPDHYPDHFLSRGEKSLTRYQSQKQVILSTTILQYSPLSLKIKNTLNMEEKQDRRSDVLDEHTLNLNLNFNNARHGMESPVLGYDELLSLAEQLQDTVKRLMHEKAQLYKQVVQQEDRFYTMQLKIEELSAAQHNDNEPKSVEKDINTSIDLS